METLISLGYTGITIPQLVEVLQHGGALPERPVAITFDDGDLDVYQNAFPIMQELGLVGTFFVVGTRLDSNEFIQVDQLKEMTGAGWAIGCHSMTHIDLTLNHEALTYEAGVCKSTLEEKVGVPVSTFAYPFGTMDEFVAGKVSKYGYTSAVGLGTSSTIPGARCIISADWRFKMHMTWRHSKHFSPGWKNLPGNCKLP